MTDQYDTLLRSMDEGLLITVNNNDPNATPSDEMKVTSSSDNKTDVLLEGWNGGHYTIMNDGDLKMYELDNGYRFIDYITTIEVLGIDE